MGRTMQAYRIPEWQQPAEVVEVPVPTAGPGQAVVKVSGCGLCHSDFTMLDMPAETGRAWGWSMPFTLGHETAGRIAELGPGVTGFAPGDPVALVSPSSCGTCSFCVRGLDGNCPHAPRRTRLRPGRRPRRIRPGRRPARPAAAARARPAHGGPPDRRRSDFIPRGAPRPAADPPRRHRRRHRRGRPRRLRGAVPALAHRRPGRRGRHRRGPAEGRPANSARTPRSWARATRPPRRSAP
ncbi:alcohol dehydrogenase catalytic domain-containing protein [Yinghuangia aomiensis]